jgi:pilus assembly protein Flp/PilA
MLQALKLYWRDEAAATAIEYGLIASLIAVVVLSILARTGTQLNGKYTVISNGLN